MVFEKPDPDVQETLGTWGIIMCLDFEQMYIKNFSKCWKPQKLGQNWKPDEICTGFFFLQKLDILIISLMTYLNLQ